MGWIFSGFESPVFALGVVATGSAFTDAANGVEPIQCFAQDLGRRCAPRVFASAPNVPVEGFGTLHNHHDDGRHETMLPETRRYLSALFRPYNEQLADILGEEWRGVWD